MLSDTLLFLGSAVFVLALLEIFLSETQQKQISTRMVKFWDWLDRFKDALLRDSIFNVRGAVVWSVTIMVGVIALIHAPEFARKMSLLKEFLPLTSAAILSLVTGHLVLKRSLNRGLVRDLLSGAVALGALAFATIYVPQLVYENLLKPEDLYNKQTDLGLFLVTIYGLLLMCFWLTSYGMFLLGYIFTWVVRILELIVRRLAEYPKGPILALSAIFTACVALMRILVKSG
jgi:hypothetical protein